MKNKCSKEQKCDIIRYVRPAWRNGRRDRLKIYCQRWREGSSPLAGTKEYNDFTKSRFYVIMYIDEQKLIQ